MTHETPSVSSAERLRTTRRQLLRATRRLTQAHAAAEDLVQQAMLESLERDAEHWSDAQRAAWLRGVVRRRAAFDARTERRRREREAQWCAVLSGGALLSGDAAISGDADGTSERWSSADEWQWAPSFLERLPASVRQVATLVAADLTSAEIRWILGIADTALRQRFRVLRQQIGAWPSQSELPIRRAVSRQAIGAERVALVRLLRSRGDCAFALTDPDGHLLVVGPKLLTQQGEPATRLRRPK